MRRISVFACLFLFCACATLGPRGANHGRASWYGKAFQGRRTASGERFDRHAMTAAHRTLPFGTKVQVTNVASGKKTIVRINDRGPASRDRLIDVSESAALALGFLNEGHAEVELKILD